MGLQCPDWMRIWSDKNVSMLANMQEFDSCILPKPRQVNIVKCLAHVTTKCHSSIERDLSLASKLPPLMGVIQRKPFVIVRLTRWHLCAKCPNLGETPQTSWYRIGLSASNTLTYGQCGGPVHHKEGTLRWYCDQNIHFPPSQDWEPGLSENKNDSPPRLWPNAL